MSDMATRDAYGEFLRTLEGRDDIVVLDADLSKSTKTAEFKKVNPNNFVNAGIAEQNLMGMGAGIAATGKIAICSTFAVFATGRAFEVIRNSICYPRLNVKVCATHAGVTVGEDGGSHESIEDLSIMRSLPNMVVLNPCDGIETKKVMEEIMKYDGPCYVRLGRPKVKTVMPEDYEFKMGVNPILKEGSDITIIATGLMVGLAMEAAEELLKDGIKAEIINGVNIKPFDSETLLKSVKKTNCVLSCEEHSIIGGLGSAVAEVISENHPVRLNRLGVNDHFGESGSPDDLLKKYKLTSEEIVKRAKELVRR